MNNEAKLIKQIIQDSNQGAANQLVAKYYKEIYAYVYKQTINKDLSLDLTQEIFISVLQSLHHYEEKKSSFKTWLYRIATNRIVDYYRSKHYRSNQLNDSIEDYDFQGEEDFTILLEQKEEVEKVTNIVSRLDAFTQQIFRLKLFAEYTFTEISNILQLPEATVKTKYYSMIRKIKNSVQEEKNA